MPPAETIGDRIKQLRGHTSQAEYATHLGVHKNTLANYERNERLPDAEFLSRLRDRFDADINWLLTGVEPGQTAPPTSSSASVDEELMNYTLAIVEKTRQHEYLSLGVSPRGSMSLYRAAQALALTEGRNYCVPDDFKRLVLPVFAHRCIVNSRYLSTLKKSDQAEVLVREIIESTPVPI